MKRILTDAALRLVDRLPAALLRPWCTPSPAVLLYHVVSNEDLPHIRPLYAYKSLEEFEADLVYLRGARVPVSYDEFASAYAQQHRLHARAVLVTFDDAYAECYTMVRPLLQKHGIPAAFFVTTGLVGNQRLFYRNKVALALRLIKACDASEWHGVSAALRPLLDEAAQTQDTAAAAIAAYDARFEDGIDAICAALGIDCAAFLDERRPYLSVEQVRALSRDGFTIGAHTVSHPRLETLSVADARREICESCDAVRQWTGQAQVACAFPYEKSPSAAVLAALSGERRLGVLFATPAATGPDTRLVERVSADTPPHESTDSTLPRLLWKRDRRRAMLPHGRRAAHAEIRA